MGRQQQQGKKTLPRWVDWLDKDAIPRFVEILKDDKRYPDSVRAYEERVAKAMLQLLQPIVHGVKPTNTDLMNSLTLYPPLTWQKQFCGLGTAVGVNYRSGLAARARFAKYDFRTSVVSAYLRQHGKIDTALLRTHGSDFFGDLVQVYFAVFGRSATFNEHILDNYERARGPHGSSNGQIVTSDLFDPEHPRPFAVHYHQRKSSEHGVPPIKLSAGRAYCSLSVSSKLTESLLLDDEDDSLADQFFLHAWDCFQATRSKKDRSPHESAGKLNTDWITHAVKMMEEASKEHEHGASLTRRLAMARASAEHIVLSSSTKQLGNTLSSWNPIPDISPTEKLRELLSMLQGALCLIAWETPSWQDGQSAISFVTCPVLSNEKTDLGTVSASWTFVLDDGPGKDTTSWPRVQQIATTLIGEILSQYPPFPPTERNSARSLPWNPPPSEDAVSEETRDKEFLDICKSINDLIVGSGTNVRIFSRVAKWAMQLTGGAHEARPTSYSLIVGPGSLLKYVARVVSQENGEYSATPNARPENEKEAFWRSVLSSHHSLFGDERVAAFFDAGKPDDEMDHPLDCVVALRHPTISELEQMRRAQIPEDEYASLRYLTYQLRARDPAPAIGFRVEKDGILRIFVGGRLLLLYNPRSANPQRVWRAGIEGRRHLASPKGNKDSEGTQCGLLQWVIADALSTCDQVDDCTNGSHMVNDLMDTITAISNSPGEGTTLLIDGSAKAEKPASMYLCEMVPSDFRMQWARDRQLSGTERRILHSLAIMDGALCIRGSIDKGLWACGRRYLAPDPRDTPDVAARTVDDVIRDYLKPSIQTIEQVRDMLPGNNSESINARRRLAAGEIGLMRWLDRLAGTGTRHQSVLHFCAQQMLNASKLPTASPNDPVIERKGPLICTVSADGPVRLYRVEKWKYHAEPFIWTMSVVD